MFTFRMATEARSSNCQALGTAGPESFHPLARCTSADGEHDSTKFLLTSLFRAAELPIVVCAPYSEVLDGRVLALTNPAFELPVNLVDSVGIVCSHADILISTLPSSLTFQCNAASLEDCLALFICRSVCIMFI